MKQSVCQIRRTLGYVEFVAGKQDQHGWKLLLESQHIKDYVQIVTKVGGATASTAKNYVDKMLLLMKVTLDSFFDEAGMPTEPAEVSYSYLLASFCYVLNKNTKKIKKN